MTKKKQTDIESPTYAAEDWMKGMTALMQASLKDPKTFAMGPWSMMMEMNNILMGKPSDKSEKTDKRFDDQAWALNPVYKRIMQTYLELAERTDAYISDVGLDDKNEKRIKFIADNLVASMSPTNSLLGNPKALKKAYETGGASLLEGGKNYLDDMMNNAGMPSMVNKSAFKLGENVAVTPGKVVYRSDMLELIQYTPATEQVHQIPLLMVPPQINKFYVYDIAQNRSFIEYIVSKGFQVFAVSWKNPTAKERDWGFSDYVIELEKVSEVVADITESEKINAIGACSGGITTATLLAYLAAKKVDRVNSFSLLVSVLDSGATGDTSLGLFIHKEVLKMAKMSSSGSGVLKGEDLAKIFAWLRPNDLIWPYWVNNYLMGEKPPEFDLLFWNSDTTNLPSQLHSDFINMLESNPLVEAGAISIDNHPIDLKNVDCDTYVVAGSTDHITPWEACYRTVNMLGGNTEFILSSSGHVQAIINPPTNRKAEFYRTDEVCKDSDEFLQKAERNAGTWWEHWSAWLAERSGDKKAAPQTPGTETYPVLEDAPGSYARGWIMLFLHTALPRQTTVLSR